MLEALFTVSIQHIQDLPPSAEVLPAYTLSRNSEGVEERMGKG